MGLIYLFCNITCLELKLEGCITQTSQAIMVIVFQNEYNPSRISRVKSCSLKLYDAATIDANQTDVDYYVAIESN